MTGRVILGLPVTQKVIRRCEGRRNFRSQNAHDHVGTFRQVRFARDDNRWAHLSLDRTRQHRYNQFARLQSESSVSATSIERMEAAVKS